MEVYGRDDAHVRLPPFATAIGHLAFEEFQCVKTELWLRDLEGAAQDGAGLVLDEQECAVCFPLSNLLQQAEQGDSGKEEAGGIIVEWQGRQRIVQGMTELVNFRARWRGKRRGDRFGRRRMRGGRVP